MKTTNEKLKEIKQSFRFIMNGEASKSMRDKGLTYNINWGINIPALHKIAEEYGKDYDLALALWAENIRECKILCVMIMPSERMSQNLAEEFMAQTTSQEIAEMSAFYLYRYLPFAQALACKWLVSDNYIWQIGAYTLLAHLFTKGIKPDEHAANVFLSHVKEVFKNSNLGVKHSATTCIMRFAELGDTYQDMAKAELAELNLPIFA